jgi:hypothetical protein
MAEKEDAAPTVEVPTVTFAENTNDTVTASFPSMNGSIPFEVTLQNMHWGLVEDIERMGSGADVRAMLNFFEEYIVGGPSAVPFKHTMTVFNAIRGYIEYSSNAAKNE